MALRGMCPIQSSRYDDSPICSACGCHRPALVVGTFSQQVCLMYLRLAQTSFAFSLVFPSQNLLSRPISGLVLAVLGTTIMVDRRNMFSLYVIALSPLAQVWLERFPLSPSWLGRCVDLVDGEVEEPLLLSGGF